MGGEERFFLPRCGAVFRCAPAAEAAKVAVFAEVFGVERLPLFVVEVEPVFAVSVAGQDMPLQREDLPVFVVVTQAAADFASAVVEVVKGQTGLRGGDGETAFVVGVERASFFRVNGAVCGVSLSW